MPSITKELKAGLLLLAAELPEEKALVGQVVTGAQAMSENPLSRQKTGQPLDPDARYRRLVPTGSVNHGKRLVRAYERGGRNNVLAYCKKYIEPQRYEDFAAKLSALVPA